MNPALVRVLVLAWDAMVRRHRIDQQTTIEARARAARALKTHEDGSVRMLNDVAAWLDVYEADIGERDDHRAADAIRARGRG